MSLITMENGSHSEIMRSLGRLEAHTSGIIARLDALNGKVAAQEKRIGDIEISDGEQNVKLGMVATVAAGIGSIISAVVVKMF